jgi:hypothetical protein
VRISGDSVGVFPVAAPVKRLRESCLLVRDTVLTHASGGAEDVKYPGLVWSYRDVTVLALQYVDSVLLGERPPDGWVVQGGNIRIVPGETPLTTPWAELYSLYGTAQASAGDVVVIRFCSLPRMLFTLDVDPGEVRTTSGRVDLATIPPTAQVHHVFIMAESLARSFRPCA